MTIVTRRHSKGRRKFVAVANLSSSQSYIVANMRLLLIEDDSMLARGISAALSQSGYVVEVAPTAESALKLARNSAFGVGILDLGLPDRDGIDLLRDLRAAGVPFPILIL